MAKTTRIKKDILVKKSVILVPDAGAVCAAKIEKIPPLPLYKKILDTPGLLASEVFAFVIYICPMLNRATANILLDEPSSAEKFYFDYKQEEFLEEFRKNTPQIIEEFENEFHNLKFVDLINLQSEPCDIEYRIKFLKLLKDKKIFTDDSYFTYKADDCIGLFGFVNNIKKEDYDFYVSVLNDGLVDDIINSEKIHDNSYKIRLINRINEKKLCLS